MKMNAYPTKAGAAARSLFDQLYRSVTGATRLLSVVACAALFAVSAAAQSGQSEPIQQRWVGDLPIMNAMTIEPQLGFAFDSPEGRIVQVFATGPDDSAAVIAYYNDALSGLGWSGQGGRWNRADEALTISQVKMATGMLWRIRLNPR